ncbi:hypothetical protein ACX9NE_28180 [Mycobacterium sp. ML4]
MAAVGPPTRSRIEAFDQTADLLTEAAAQWRARAAVMERAAHAYLEQLTSPGGTAWDGQAAGSAVQMAHTETAAVLAAVAHADQMADVAHRGGEDLRGARAEALEAIAEAEDDGFEVGEDLSVTDMRAAHSPAQQIARHQHAETHRSFIAHRVARLAAANATITTTLHAGATHMAGMAPAHWHQPRHRPGRAGPRPACTHRRPPHKRRPHRRQPLEARPATPRSGRPEGHDRGRSGRRLASRQRRPGGLQRPMRTHLRVAQRTIRLQRLPRRPGPPAGTASRNQSTVTGLRHTSRG